MELKLDISKVTKVVMKKDDDTYIEYTLNNGVIEDVEIIEKEKTIEEKLNDLRSNPDVKKVNSLIKISDNAGVLTKMVEGGYTSIASAIKDTVMNEPLDGLSKTPNNPIDNTYDKLSKTAKRSSEIMKEDKKMNEAAKDFREAIANKLSKDETDADALMTENAIDEALSINNREQRITYLKDAMSKINKENE